MPITSIAVHVDSEPRSRARVELAHDLAQRLDAHLIGLGAVMLQLAADPSGYAIPAQVLAMQEQATERALAAAEASFHSVVPASSGAEWRGAFDMPAEFVARQARAADLVVIGHRNPAGSTHFFLDPGEFLLRAGRPALIVPPHLRTFPLDSPALVAWKDTREARRAVADALPLLRAAPSVSVIGISGERERKSEQASLVDVADYLRRNGVSIEVVKAESGAGDAGRTLLSLARLQEAGLIVLGAYGHSRFSEWAFGGVTRELLTEAHISCLMSH